MPQITILPETLSNKIAAGEVVERPASVLKELMENAIDAQSTRILVEIRKGGRQLVRVSDNGMGMDRDDALLSIERYATSKIHTEKDLCSIATLGFRGEALPSVASVSEMEIVTSTGTSDAGTQIVVEGGKVKRVSEVGAPRGTVVSVRRLFFNTPARRKFLKTEKTELGHISDILIRMGLALPEIHLRFLHNGRVMGNWVSTDNLLARILEVLGQSLQGHLYEVAHRTSRLDIRGFAGSPSVAGTTSRGIYVYVNGRFVRDKVVNHAIMQGYTGHLMKGRFPLVVLFVKLPHDQVDVNVHPTKNAVRFESPGNVHNAVADAVSKSLKEFDRPLWGNTAPPTLKPYEAPRPYRLYRSENRIRQPEPAYQPTPAKAEVPAPLWVQKPFSQLKVLGQLRNTYIVCESDDGLVLIDQHAAHERIVFESLKSAYSQSAVPVQGLLLPETIELRHREATILETLIEELNALGLAMEAFGGTTYVIRSVPALLKDKPAKPLVMEILDKAAEIDLVSDLQHLIDESLVIMACHGAIRANQKLAPEQIRALLEQLDHIDNPSHCPHGRPTYIIRTFRQVEKDFKRIV